MPDSAGFRAEALGDLGERRTLSDASATNKECDKMQIVTIK